MNDNFNLDRFARAQQGAYEGVIAELERGRKTGHWIWYIFPQVSGLGHSDMSRRYSISSLAEAEAYLEHPVLGPRLIHCTKIVLALTDKSARQVFGPLDALKFRSCMTLFALAGNNGLFNEALEKYFDGKPDPLTIRALRAGPA